MLINKKAGECACLFVFKIVRAVSGAQQFID